MNNNIFNFNPDVWMCSFHGSNMIHTIELLAGDLVILQLLIYKYIQIAIPPNGTCLINLILLMYKNKKLVCVFRNCQDFSVWTRHYDPVKSTEQISFIRPLMEPFWNGNLFGEESHPIKCFLLLSNLLLG